MFNPVRFVSRAAALAALLLLAYSTRAVAQPQYVPGPGSTWERRQPQALGVNPAGIAQAIEAARNAESGAPRSLEEAHYQTFGREPFGLAVGPFKDRGDQTGMIVYRGYVIAEWGEPARVDMTFSVTKSFLSTTVGLAYDRGMIRDVDEPVWRSMAPILHASSPSHIGEGGRGVFDARTTVDLFATEHNRTITWRHLLQQTSDWEGVLWGKPEWADRPSNQPATWWTRERLEAGARHEYNDTRVNVLALAAMNIWRRPLPEVLREYVMDPIGASPTWRWFGYDNSWVVIDGQLMQAVSGGGHWGGGMFISAEDQARFGVLTCRGGRWGDKQIVSANWNMLSRTPTQAQQDYGFMNFYLNTGQRRMRSAPENAFVHLGNGTNAVVCVPDRDLVIVLRWFNQGALNGIVEQVLGALPPTQH